MRRYLASEKALRIENTLFENYTIPLWYDDRLIICELRRWKCLLSVIRTNSENARLEVARNVAIANIATRDLVLLDDLGNPVVWLLPQTLDMPSHVRLAVGDFKWEFRVEHGNAVDQVYNYGNRKIDGVRVGLHIHPCGKCDAEDHLPAAIVKLLEPLKINLSKDVFPDRVDSKTWMTQCFDGLELNYSLIESDSHLAPLAINSKLRFEVGGIMYHSIAQWVAAAKATFFGDFAARSAILHCNDPHECMDLAKSIESLAEHAWIVNRRRLCIMGNVAKCNQYPDLKQMLVDTHGSHILEVNAQDPLWGTCPSQPTLGAPNYFSWKGENLHGFILMDVREYFRSTESLLNQTM